MEIKPGQLTKININGTSHKITPTLKLNKGDKIKLDLDEMVVIVHRGFIKRIGEIRSRCQSNPRNRN